MSKKLTTAPIIPGNAATALSPSLINRFAFCCSICFIHSLLPGVGFGVGPGFGLGSGPGPGPGSGLGFGFGFGFGVADFTRVHCLSKCGDCKPKCCYY